MYISNINSLTNILEDSIFCANNVLLITHKNPDGDGLAACLALKMIIEKLFKKETYVFLQKEAPDFLEFLNVSQHTNADLPHNKFDLVITIDCHEYSRTDAKEEIFENAKNVIFIDHHEINKSAILEKHLYYIDPNAVCTGIILHNALKHLLQKMNTQDIKYYAECIYTTIINDTDNFVNNNTDKDSFQVCTELMDYGLNPNYVVTEFLLKKTPAYYKFVGNVLSTIDLHEKGKVLFIHSSLEMLNNLGLANDATSKMMRWVKGAKDVEIQVFFQQIEEKLFRISFRSDIYDVDKLAYIFDGGGHKRAAGGTVRGTLTEVKQQVLKQIELLK